MKSAKQKALATVFSAAQSYQDNLINQSLLFVCVDKHKKVLCVEVTFDKSNFKHLTGFKTEMEASLFFDRCINKRLSEKDFEFSEDGTTPLKMKVLLKIVSKNLSANMIGDYNLSRPKLYTEKIAGNVAACIGFIRNKENGRYVPNTLLEGDIRSLVKSTARIIVTYRKKRNEKNYSEIVYKAKKVDWNCIVLPKEYEYLSLPID